MPSFDIRGWLSSADIPGRQTSVNPPAHGSEPEVGQPWPNWTGSAWVMLDYLLPEPSPSAASPSIPADANTGKARIVRQLKRANDKNFAKLMTQYARYRRDELNLL